MNIIKTVKARIEKRLLETKNACKTYATETMAEHYADELAKRAAEHFDTARPAHYVIVFIESVERYAIAFDINELCNRPDAKGGFVGIFGEAGHYSF